MTDREVMQMALDVVQRYSKETPLGNQPHMIAQVAYECIEALRTALAQPEEAPTKLINVGGVLEQAGYVKRKEWVGLTAQDLADVGVENYIGAIWADGRLQEKNR